MINDKQLEMYPLTKNVLEYMNTHYVLYAKTYAYIKDVFNEDFLAFSENILSLVKRKLGSDDKFVKCIKAFIKYSHEYFILQVKLNKSGKYLYSSFQEVNHDIYQSEKMNEYYLDGLLLSQILWPNHYIMGKYFIDHAELTKPSSIILDIPSGTGIYAYFLSRHFRFSKLYSYDISPHARMYAEDLLISSSRDTSNISFGICDIYEINQDRKFDFIVCGELLEHVDNPEKLLHKIKSLLKDNGSVFLTTAIYAAAIDHIYLFNNVNEVRVLLNKCFTITSELILPTSLEAYNEEMNKVPINYACILRK